MSSWMAGTRENGGEAEITQPITVRGTVRVVCGYDQPQPVRVLCNLAPQW
jgi:hypothetical protein